MADAANLYVNRIIASGDAGVGNLRSLGFRFIPTPSDETLNAKHRIFSIGDSLTLGKLTDESIAILAEADHTRSGTPTF
jgi:hypothetical protein